MPEYMMTARGKFEPHYVLAAKRGVEAFMQRTYGERYKVFVAPKHGTLRFRLPDENHTNSLMTEINRFDIHNRIRWEIKEI